MAKQQFMTLEKAIELGEYSPEYLDKFPDFRSLSRHAQFQLIRQALKNKKRLFLEYSK